MRVQPLQKWVIDQQVPFDSIDDAQRCVRYLQDNADDMGIDREKIVLAGWKCRNAEILASVLLPLKGLLGFTPFRGSLRYSCSTLKL